MSPIRLMLLKAYFEVLLHFVDSWYVIIYIHRSHLYNLPKTTLSRERMGLFSGL
jgi:hypothetical protein